MLIAILSLLLVCIPYLVSWFRVYQLAKEMEVERPYHVVARDRDPALLKDVRELEEEDEAELAQWLEDNGMPPLDYVVSKAKEYQVVILGESHLQRQSLLWGNRRNSKSLSNPQKDEWTHHLSSLWRDIKGDLIQLQATASLLSRGMF